MQKVIAQFKAGTAVTHVSAYFYMMIDDPDVQAVLNADTGELLFHDGWTLEDSMENTDGDLAYLFKGEDGYDAAAIGPDMAEAYHFDRYEAMTEYLYRKGFRF